MILDLETLFENSNHNIADINQYENNYGAFSSFILSLVNCYRQELKAILSDLNEKERNTYLLIIELGSYDPPFLFFSEEKLLRYKPQYRDDIQTIVNDLLQLGLLRIGLPDKEFDINTDTIKRTIKGVGYAVNDPLVNIMHYYKENNILPPWLKKLIIQNKKIELDHYEQELIQKIPSSAYIMSPKSRKLTNVRDKWFWVASEQKGNIGDGLEQIMYILADQEQKAANKLLQRNLLMVHSHHYGMPIYIPNSDYF